MLVLLAKSTCTRLLATADDDAHVADPADDADDESGLNISSFKAAIITWSIRTQENKRRHNTHSISSPPANCDKNMDFPLAKKSKLCPYVSVAQIFQLC